MTAECTAAGWLSVLTDMKCKKCGRDITPDEAAVTKKLINRAATDYYCARCLAEAFEVAPEDIWRKVQYFKEIGCTLFQ